MLEIGLQPTDTGLPGGKSTGDRVTHYIIPGEKFDKVMSTYEAKRGTAILWKSGNESLSKKAKINSKTKFACPDCQQAAWAKPSAKLVCGECDQEMVAVNDVA